MFEPSAHKVERKIKKLGKEIKHIDSEIKRITKRMRELSGRLILPKYITTYNAILRDIERVSSELTEVTDKISEEKLEILHSTPARGVIDISGVEPSLIKRYLSLQKRMNELIKQEAHIERLSDVDKHSQLRADGFYIVELKNKKEEKIREITRLNKAKR